MMNLRFPSIAVVVIVVTGVLLYGHTLPFPFVFDDHVYLVQNPLVKDAHSFAYNGDFVAFSTYSRRAGLDPDLSVNFILRPVTYFTFYINYIIGGMKPAGFRAVNIAIHCANAVLFFIVLLHLLRESRKSGSLTAVSENFISFVAALFFLVHPLQTESVTYVVQRFTSLAVFFYLLTILTYFISHSTVNKITARFFRWTSVFVLVVGMLSKEDLFTVPFMLVALDWLVMGIPLKLVWRRTLPYFCCLPIIPALIGLTAWAQQSGTASLAAAVNITNPYPDPNYPYHYALTQLSAVLTYLRLILVPYGQNLDWEYPLSKSLWDTQVISSVAIIGGILLVTWWLYYKRQADARRSLIFCSVIWYFVTIAISSSIIPLPDVMVEHRCYIATIGAFTAMACCIDIARTYFVDRQVLSRTVAVFAGVWILALIGATVARNEVWRSEISNWTDVISKSPGKFRPLMNLGVAYVEHGKPRKGIACFRKALLIEPALICGYENLATVENSLQNYGEALIVTQVGLKCAPQSIKLHFNQAVAYNGLGQKQKSVEWFKKSIGISPAHKQSHLALGMLYSELKQYDEALKHYKIAASLPAFREFDAQLRYNIAQMEQMVRQHAGPPMAMAGQ